jgi:hypothetical protein
MGSNWAELVNQGLGLKVRLDQIYASFAFTDTSA